jgi:hypothetical protein
MAEAILNEQSKWYPVNLPKELKWLKNIESIIFSEPATGNLCRS